MKTILSIIKKELKERISHWVTLIFFGMLVIQAIWVTDGGFKYFANEGVLMNAASILYRNYAGMGMLMIIIIAIATGGVLYKDIRYKSANWTYALPINDKQFFIGRFMAAFLYLVILSTGLIVGHLLVPYSGIGGGVADRFGPVQWGPLFHGWLMFTVPNLFFLCFHSIFFGCIHKKNCNKLFGGFFGCYHISHCPDLVRDRWRRTFNGLCFGRFRWICGCTALYRTIVAIG